MQGSIKKITLYCAFVLLAGESIAQSAEDRIRATGLPVLPVITNATIPGAPLLGQPVLIKGTQQDVRTEKHGLVYPLLYDWNKDGRPDLLLGEFETGQTGSDIKVFLNEGTVKKPAFSGKYFYARDVNGDTMTAHQWCCIGTHPRLADLNNDGITDMLSGQYNPGLINWWPGTPEGFAPRRYVDQEGYSNALKPDIMIRDQLDPKSMTYWNYTSAGFADINGDGLVDLLVGGISNAELRYALNTGTAGAPKFGPRRFLLDVNGLPLSVVKPSEKALQTAKENFVMPHYAGVQKSFMTPVDWDGDGVLDLLVTHMYGDSVTRDPVVFFRGVQTSKGLRFRDAVPLFTAENARKTFPGCQPNITVADYNGDGINDLIIGVSLPTVNGFQVDSLVAWSYLHDLRIESPGKDAGRAVEWEGSLDNLKKKVREHPEMKQYYLGKLEDEKYLTLRHRGYVYVMLGKRNPVRATPETGVVALEEKQVENKVSVQGEETGPVRFRLNAPGAVVIKDSGVAEVHFSFMEGWYGYAETAGNMAAGWIPTKVEFTLPEGMEPVGDPVKPASKFKGGTEVYVGNDLRFAQQFRYTGVSKNGKMLKPGTLKIKVDVQYQTCNEQQCLPPEKKSVELPVRNGY